MISLRFSVRIFTALFACAALALASSPRDDGIEAFHAGRYSVALAKLAAAVHADSSDQTARLFLALTQAARNDCPSALPVLTALAASRDDTQARLAGLAEAKCLESSGDSSRAAVVLAKLQQRFPADAGVLYMVASFHMNAFNDATFALFEHAPASWRVHQLSARIFEIQDRYDEAAAEYRKAIALNPTAPDLHYQLGRALLLAAHGPGSLRLARAEFQAELQVSPEDAASEFQLAQIAQAENQHGAARAHFERALALAPDFPEALIAVGKLDAQAKHYPAAIALLEHATRLQPANESAHYALMLAYRDSGNLDKAKSEQATLDRLRKPPEGEFTDFLKKLGEKPPQP